MTRRTFRRAAGVLLLCITGGPALAAGVGAQDSARSRPGGEALVVAVDRYVQTLMRDDRVPGAAIVIVHGDSVVMLRGYGVDGSGQAVTPATGFVLGSMSKAFTALALMQLVGRGHVDLDARVQQYLPWFHVRDRAASSRITVRHLLQHTSGIPEKAPRARGDALTIAAHVRALSDVALAHEPGTTHEYASPNYLALAAIVEAASGKPYATYVQESIVAPLRMTHTFTDQDRALERGMSRGHRYVFGFPAASLLPYEADRMPTAALISSADDLGRFLIAQLNEGRFGDRSLLAPALMRAMHTEGARADGFSYGFGWRLGTIGGARAVHHGGIVPHFRGKMVMLPDERWGVAVLTNVSSSLPLPLVPTSHRMADGIAAYLAGVPLDATASRHRLFGYLLLVFALGVVSWQLWGILTLRRARGRGDGSGIASRSALGWAIGLDVAWVAFVTLVMPRLLGLTWPELFRAVPDVSWWLVVVLALTAVTVAMRVQRLARGETAARSST